MESFVVDATVVIDYLISDTFTSNTDALFRLLNKQVALHIPEFCLLECTNVLWKRVRFHNLDQSRAERLLKGLIALPMIVNPVDALLQRGLEIGLQYELAVYDSLYIALAEHLNCPLITVDSKQETAARAAGITIKPVTDFSS
jgi:predicted nucleic acid-binding protein